MRDLTNETANPAIGAAVSYGMQRIAFYASWNSLIYPLPGLYNN